jgi:hypothetical protein
MNVFKGIGNRRYRKLAGVVVANKNSGLRAPLILQQR